MIEQVDQADHLAVGDQGQRHEAVLAVTFEVGAFGCAQTGVAATADTDGALCLDGAAMAGPATSGVAFAHPGRVIDAVGRRGQTDQRLALLEPVDVAVGNRNRRRQAAGGRLQQLAELEARGQLEARGKQQVVAPFGLLETSDQALLARRPGS